MKQFKEAKIGEIAGNIETMIGKNGEVYLSANDLCAFLRRGAIVIENLGKTVPHPLVAMQTKSTSSALKSLSDSLEFTANKEKNKQPSAN